MIGTGLGTFKILAHMIFVPSDQDGNVYSHFTDKETVALVNKIIICPRSLVTKIGSLVSNPALASSPGSFYSITEESDFSIGKEQKPTTGDENERKNRGKK